VTGARRVLAMLAVAAGNPAEGLDQAEAAVAAARQSGDSWEVGVTLAIKASVIAANGDLEGARTAHEQALAAIGDNRGWVVATVRYGLGRLARICGDPVEARGHFEDALAVYRQIDARPQIVRCLASIGQLALGDHDLPAARACLTEAMALTLVTGQRQAIARSVAALATLAAASDDLAAAVRLAGTARTLFEALSAPQASAQGRLDVLIDAARAELGQESVRTLLAEGRGMSAHQAARQVTASAADRVTPREPAYWPGPLTEREREVALLVADGLGNRAIADSLFITQATAARHVANIFAKLDFSSRAQLIAWVVRSARRGDG
jgi:DNA-binding NarL/FixJ family response regulator